MAHRIRVTPHSHLPDTHTDGYRERALPPARPAWFFPPVHRDFPGRRWAGILLRTAHLMGVAGVGGAFLYAVPPADWAPYLWLTVVSGLLLLGLDLWSHGAWLLQLRGLAILVKLLLLALMPLAGATPWLLLTVVALSGIFAHAPARVRYYAPFHGRRMEIP